MGVAVDNTHNERTMIERRDALIGEVFDRRFRIEARIAAGGFGAIYRATHIRSGQPLALKVLHANLTHDEGVVARFRREGAALTRLRDPHTITAYELGEAPDGMLYIVMELLHGESLYERFRSQGPLPWARMLAIARAVCSSLAEAHALGIIHRDLKPTNIHLEPGNPGEDFVKVLDFGIAKIVQGTDLEHTQLTQAGQMIGTVDYMSPEQMVGGELTPASDIYTLGVVIYEMIAGRTPFADAQSATAILAAVLTRAPDPLSTHARVPVLLDRIVARCLERDPQSRFTDVGDLVEALAEVAAGGGARHTPAVPANDFAQPVLTTEATRIDVRFSESSQPVLDARGARRRMPDRSDAPAPVARQRQVTPAPPTVVGNIQGSNNAIDVRGMSPSRGAQPEWRPPAVVPIATPHHVPPMQPRAPIPASPVPTLAGGTAPPPPPAMPHPAPAMTPHPAPAMTPYPAPARTPHPAAAMPPQAAPAMPPAAQAVVPVLPGSAMFPAVVPPPMKSPRPFFPIEPTVGAPRYSATFTAVSGYDMAAAASYDKLVRRIIWAAVIIAVIAAAVIALH